MIDMSAALEIITRSSPGMVRTNNEDSVLANAPAGFVVLADGMGGYNAGEVASGMATALLGCELEQAFQQAPAWRREEGRSRACAVLEREVAKANGAIFQAAQSQPQYAGMGTTLVAAVFHDNRLAVAHLGDSRLYRNRGTDFIQVTRDHSLLQEQIDSGLISAEDARHAEHRNLVTRALGVEPEAATEIHEYEVKQGDIYLLCSDGLNDMVDDDDIAMTLQLLAVNLDLCATQLIQMANDNGGRDNVSVILVKIKHEFPARDGWISRFSAWFAK
ncbi:MAG: Stp1/IreP family PP2C-type Ser/Thr phosphatase [Proteobacteria bacterium]|nr:Stp1/IreP family PP2C-type Ser/Thr phosphatase [Pseudomonadota bacterium]HQR03984.1 Stp1/IreP family PP2C-type Ser/Thr phosphatase [Rhodocyclaceae bacterium]